MKNMREISRKALALRYVSRGYIYINARLWIDATKREKKRAPLAHKLRVKNAHRCGYLYSTVEKYNLEKQDMKKYVSQRDYLYTMPINQTYQKWLNNLITMYHILQPYREYMAQYYYHITRRDGERFIIPLKDGVNRFDYEDLREDLQQAKILHVVSLQGDLVKRLKYDEGSYYLADEEVGFDEIIEWIQSTVKEYVIMESIADRFQDKVRENYLLYVVNENGNDAKIADVIDRDNAELQDSTRSVKNILGKNYQQVVDCVENVSAFLPQIQYMGMEICLVDGCIFIDRMVNRPEYLVRKLPSTELTKFLSMKLHDKEEVYKDRVNIKKRGSGVVKRFLRKTFARTFYPKGLKPYISYTWIRDLWMDFRTQKEVSFRNKMYAYKNGFLSYRLGQYGVTEDTRYKYISDFEYKWLRHINSDYRVWLEDKNTIKYIAGKYNESFPQYYYFVGHRNGKVQIIGLHDCPKKGELVYDDIITLIKEKKCLALKPDEGSHGDGFYRCEYIKGEFYLNFERVEIEDIIQILSDENNSYIITEYINMHNELKRIYSGSVNTLRAIVFKVDGRTPEIGNVYMRIGTSSTGAIDNMSAGGMFAAVNEVTGEYGNAKRFVDGNIVDCPIHPDTGILIEGVLPNWEKTKGLIIDIATELKQLEYFGFDLAITEDGIKIPEINRSPDYPRIEKFTDRTNEYLLGQLEKKKKQYGYDNNKCNKIMSLPKR